MNISVMSEFEYFLAFAGYQSALSNQYFRECAKNGIMLCAREGISYAGYIFAMPENECVRITYVYVMPEHRQKGICTELFQNILKTAGQLVRVTVMKNHEYYEPLFHVCKKLGFRQGESVAVFTCYRENYPAWERFMEKKGSRLCAFLKHQGFQAVSFQDADEGLIWQVRNSFKTDYANPLDPEQFFSIPEKKMSMKMSFAAVRDGTLAAYTLVTQRDKTKVIFEHISDNIAYRGTGVILLPFAAAMSAYQQSDCDVVSYAMYGSNRHANAFRTKLLSVLQTSASELENYYHL